MRDENILNINVANGVSIVIMAMVGFFLLQLLRRAIKGKVGSDNPLTSQQGSSPATGMTAWASGA